MTINTAEELAGIRAIARVVSDVLLTMSRHVAPGISTKELDDIGRAALATHGARSAPELCYQFPGATCISVNSTVAHGIPGPYRLVPGDLVNIDVSAELGGFFADTGASFPVPPISEKKRTLINATRQALESAVASIQAGMKINRIGTVFDQIASANGLTIIRNLGSHGVGRALHEEPTYIAPFFDARDTRQFHEGMVITVEPFLSDGANHTVDADDGWGLIIPPEYCAAQFEHTVLIGKDGAEVLTSLDFCPPLS